jgi:hypothetical protein
MLYAFHGPIHGQGNPVHLSLKSVLLTTGTLIFTILAILILFLFMFDSRAI